MNDQQIQHQILRGLREGCAMLEVPLPLVQFIRRGWDGKTVLRVTHDPTTPRLRTAVIAFLESFQPTYRRLLERGVLKGPFPGLEVYVAWVTYHEIAHLKQCALGHGGGKPQEEMTAEEYMGQPDECIARAFANLWIYPLTEERWVHQLLAAGLLVDPDRWPPHLQRALCGAYGQPFSHEKLASEEVGGP